MLTTKLKTANWYNCFASTVVNKCYELFHTIMTDAISSSKKLISPWISKKMLNTTSNRKISGNIRDDHTM